MDKNYNISTEEIASIERYLLGESDAGQKLAFENKLAADSSWAAKVNEVKLLMAGIEKAALKQQLDSYHIHIKKNQLQKGGGSVITLNRKRLAAASIALLAAVSVWLFISKENKYEKLYAAYYKPDPGLMSAMSVYGNYLFNKAMLDYKTGNYKKAIEEWGKLKTGMPQNDTLNYFLGAAQQAVGNDAEAVVLLEPVINDTARAFYKDACWYMGLALLKQGKPGEAIPYLEKSGRPESSELISKLK